MPNVGDCRNVSLASKISILPLGDKNVVFRRENVKIVNTTVYEAGNDEKQQIQIIYDWITRFSNVNFN